MTVTPDTHYTGTNGISVYYDSSVWSVCRMTEDPTLGTVLELATADTADSEDYQAVLSAAGHRQQATKTSLRIRKLTLNKLTASSNPARST